MKNISGFFIIGLVLFLTSVPPAAQIVMELVHKNNTDKSYKVTRVQEENPAMPSTYQAENHFIELQADPPERTYILVFMLIFFPWKKIYVRRLPS